MKNRIAFHRLAPLAIGAAAVALTASAGNRHRGEPEEIEFDEARLYFELNDTDGDLGIHGLWDGDAWKSIEIEGPDERELLNIWVRGRLRQQGLTEMFFESAEPRFDELSPARFFRRFPEGTYEIEGMTLDGKELVTVKLYPISLGYGKPRTVRGRPMLADPTLGKKIIDDLIRLSKPFGTEIEYRDGIGVVKLTAGATSP